MNEYTIRFLTPESFLDHRLEIREIYKQAFAQPPYFRTEADAVSFQQSLPRHVLRPDFRAVAAVSYETGKVGGFAYGYTAQPGQWWYDVVSQVLSKEMMDEWVVESFELAELAVLPEKQGLRLGSRLHDSILTGLPHQRAVLSTMHADTIAYRLYIKRGWISLVAPFTFPGVTRPYCVMGLRLPLEIGTSS